MQTIQFDLGGGAAIALPAGVVAQRLIERLSQPTETKHAPNRYRLGEYVSGQGGYFAGDILGDDGVTYGLITAGREATVKGKWGADGEIDGLSHWDGLTNTNALRKRGSPIADLVAGYEKDGHTDFYLPARRELIIAQANVPHLFDKCWHYTSAPCGDSNAWVVGFEGGYVGILNRSYEFAARPFRRLTY